VKDKPFFYAMVKMVITVPFAAIVAKIQAVYDKQVPIGYEDEDGFHLGSKPHS